MVILNISEFFPAPIEAKERDNDILLITASRHAAFHSEVNHIFVLTVPFVSQATALFLKEWRPFRFLAQQKKYSIQNQEIQVIPVFMRGYSISFLRPFFNWLSYLINRKRLINIIRKEHVSIIHAHNVHHTAYIASRLSQELNLPYVVTSRKIFSSLGSTAVNNILNKAEAVISINHVYKNKIDSLVPTRKSHLITHGIDTDFLSAPIKNYGDHGGPVRIISISRLLPLKNIEQTLLALEKTPVPFIYHIYGDGPDQDRLQGILSSLSIKDKVKFMGYVPHKEVPGVLAQYDLFVMPSYPEVLGRVYFEAMSIGLPVIAAKGTGVDGFIQHGISGLLIDHHNPEELQQALMRLMQDVSLQEAIGSFGQKTVSHFTWENMISKLHALYTSSLRNYKQKH